MRHPDDLLTELNTAQRNAVTHIDGPLLIVAGAGTGKTMVVTRRIGWLILSGKAKADEILALTFTEKAAGEMEERVDRILPYGYVNLWISTFHSFCDRILREHGLEIGLPSDYQLLDSTAQWMLVRKNLERFNLDYFRPLGNPTKFIHTLLKHFSRAKDEVISPAEYLAYAEKIKLDNDTTDAEGSEQQRIQEIANAYHTYNQLLLEQSALDFGDLVNYTLKLFKERPHILEKYRKQFKYVMVDEFQDTNIAQYELVKLIAAPVNNITVVCDDDQAIYKFRGASVSNILAFQKDFPSARQIFIVENFRSYQNILDLAYQFIQQNNPNRLEWQLKNNNKESGIKNIELSKQLKAKRDGKGVIGHVHEGTVTDEANTVAKTIIELHEKDPDCTWNDFAILVRANDSADPFIRALANKGIPYQFLASRGLYNKGVVLDIVAYLKLLDNYHESTALYRVLSIPVWGISHETVAELTRHAHKKTLSLFEAIDVAATIGIPAPQIQAIEKLKGFIAEHSVITREKSVSKVVLAFLNTTGYLNWLAKNMEGQGSVFAYLNQFFKKVQAFEEGTNDPSVKNFLELIDLELDAGEQGALATDDDGPEAVKILTIHGAKGLEWPYVFLTGMVDRRFPTTERKDPIALPDALIKEIIPEGDLHLEEERRLCYVAVTRARNGIFFTSADDYGGMRKKKLSRFLYELGITKPELPEAKTKKKSAVDDGLILETTVPVVVASGMSYALPVKLSFTQLKAFETCPYQYKLAHILKIPVSGRPNFSFGKTMHKTLELFCKLVIERKNAVQKDLFGTVQQKDGAPVSLDELLALYEASWIDDWYLSKKQKKEYLEKGKTILKRWYKETGATLAPPLYLEAPFTLKIDDTVLKGAIDRVDILPDGTVEIIDYKTGEKPDSPDKEQLLIYQIAMEEVFSKKPSKLTYYYLDDGSTFSFVGTGKEKEKVKQWIREIVVEMRASAFSATPSQFKCKYCDFKDICEFKVL